MMGFSGMLLLASVLIIGSANGSSRLDVIDLPLGFFPEGITNGDEWTAYVGSLATGNIWKGSLETGEGEVMEVNAPGPAVGLDHDRRSGYLFVCGGPTGTARVYDDESFDLVADLAMAGDGESSFVNDVIITKTAAYFTDSFQPKIYKVNLDRGTGALVDGSTVETLYLSDNVPVLEGEFNVNGIEAVDDGSTLIIVNSQAQQLFTVDPDTGAAAEIDLGGELLPGNGDGLVLRKNTLWVVDNSLEQIHEISLSPDLSCGVIAPRSLASPLFDTQTTAMRKGNSLYAVNAKFATADEDVPSTPYEIVRTFRTTTTTVATAPRRGSIGDLETEGGSHDSRPSGDTENCGRDARSTRRTFLGEVAALAGAAAGVLPAAVAGAGPVRSIGEVKKGIEADFRTRRYYVTGELTPSLYRPDCLFTDPATRVASVDRYTAAVKLLFDPDNAQVDLLSLEVKDDNHIFAEWRLQGYLKFPWHPYVKPYTGTTLYTLDPEGFITRHEETWSITALAAARATITPTAGPQALATPP
eukprot:g11442.t1